MKKPNEKDNFTKVYNYLQLGGRYTSQELSEKFTLSLRAIQLFLKEMQEHYGLLKEKRYYYFDDEHRHITQTQRVQMSTALMLSLYKCAIPVLHNAVKTNFKNIPKQTDAFLFDLDFQEIENENYFNQLTHAIINHLAIHFRYTNTHQKSSIKNIFPLKLTNVLGYWYLMGYDLEANKIKTFYLNNVEELTIFDESYLQQKQLETLKKLAENLVSPWFTNEQKSVVLKVEGDAMLYIQRQQTDIFTISKKEESFLEIKMLYYNDIEVLNFVKKWIPHIKIINNTQLEEKLQKMLLEYLHT